MNQNNISLEKVIKGLECHFLVDMSVCEKCPYYPNENCTDDMAKDALALLKEQEPKPPVIKENAYGWKFFYCPSCGREFYADRKHGCVNEVKFCDKCGQAVKWE